MNTLAAGALPDGFRIDLPYIDGHTIQKEPLDFGLFLAFQRLLLEGISTTGIRG